VLQSSCRSMNAAVDCGEAGRDIGRDEEGLDGRVRARRTACSRCDCAERVGDGDGDDARGGGTLGSSRWCGRIIHGGFAVGEAEGDARGGAGGGGSSSESLAGRMWPAESHTARGDGTARGYTGEHLRGETRRGAGRPGTSLRRNINGVNAWCQNCSGW
jgi:hypothetical protein